MAQCCDPDRHIYVKKTIQSDPSYILQFAALGFLPNFWIGSM